MAAQLFISYRRSRKTEVLAAKAALEAAGVRVWLDLEDIDPLADFPQRIRDGVAGSHAMLVWWSADYAESDICLQEFRLAWQHARRRSSDVNRRLWVLNPESTGQHIFAGELNSSNFLQPAAVGEEGAWAARLKARLDELELVREGPLADESHVEPSPPRFGLPAPSREFTGRGGELLRIHSALFPPRVGPKAAGVAVQTHGLGGIGKTELAAKYANDFAGAFPAGVLWLNLAGWQAARPATEVDAQNAWLRALDAALAHAPELWQQVALDAQGKPRPAPDVRERLARYLGDSQPCLVALDNLPELSPLDVRRRILDFLAAPGVQGKTLVTTRDARPVEGFAALKLDVLGPDDALRLLARYRPDQAVAESDAITALAEEVGYHAQALVLLGEQARSHPGGYPRLLDELRKRGRLARIESIAGQLREELGERARGIVATFALSIEPLPDGAKHLLALAALCAPSTPIPEALLLLAFGGEGRADEFNLALRPLERAALLERRGEDAALRLHPLLGEAALALLQPDLAALNSAIADALLERLAVLQGDESQSRFLNNEAVHAYLAASRLGSQSGVHLWLRLGQYEAGRGILAAAREAEAAALALGRNVLGEEHPDTLSSMNNLALTLRAQGDLPGARALQEKVLATRRRVLGEEHPDTLTSMNNLAVTLQAQGDLPGARALQEKALAILRRVLGEELPDTLSLMNNLAGTLLAQGELLGARQLQEKVLAIRRRMLREEHPDTLTSMNNLALTLQAQGDVLGARALQEKVLAARLRVLGEEHPDTLMSMNNLAETLRGEGDLRGAHMLQEKVLATCCRVLGEEHPGTLASMNNLAMTRQAQGDLPGARALQEKVLATSRRVLGEEHPSTLTSVNNLALTFRAQGDLPGARTLQVEELAILCRKLGEEHPDTLSSMNNLALTLRAQGDLPGARAMQETALVSRRRVLGDEHPDTLSSMNNLAATLRAQGDLPGACELQEKELAICCRVLGDEHPDTLTSMNNLAVTLSAQGDLPGARALQERVLATLRRVQGEEHPASTVSAWNLFNTLLELADHPAAQTVLTESLNWLVESDPAVLGADQREVRAYLRQMYGLADD